MARNCVHSSLGVPKCRVDDKKTKILLQITQKYLTGHLFNLHALGVFLSLTLPNTRGRDVTWHGASGAVTSRAEGGAVCNCILSSILSSQMARASHRRLSVRLMSGSTQGVVEEEETYLCDFLGSTKCDKDARF